VEVGVHSPDTKTTSSIQTVDIKQTEDPIDKLIVGKSPALQNIIAIARQVAQYPTTSVLLQGESGTGKDVVARAIHQLSGLPLSQFVPINCAAIPESLLETELFGVEEGAFTDAKVSRDGHLARANRGTLFLDEIGSMPLTLQAKLLRFLETRSFRRVGGTRELHVQLRVISATNINLQVAVAQKLFRNDLFYRLKVITLYLPPLRERREDIELLVAHFLQEESAKRRVPFTISADAMALLQNYAWPGNIRQLRSTIELGCILCNDHNIQVKDLPDIEVDMQPRSGLQLHEIQQQLLLPLEGMNLPEFIGSIEDMLIQQALTRCNGNQVRAAALLGISRDQLRYRLQAKGTCLSEKKST
jgi:two-component system, NtrC family, response regulator AtoC